MNEKEYSQYVNQCSEQYREMSNYDAFIIKKLQEHPNVSSSQLYDWLRKTYKKNFKPSYASVRLHISATENRRYSETVGNQTVSRS